MLFKESVTWKGDFLCGGWKITKFDLSILRESLLALNQV